MFKAGDVVLGKFACRDGRILRHYSVVLKVSDGGLLLAYTTSMKEDLNRANPANRFSKEDMTLANFDKPSLWDASTVSIVPSSEVRLHGRISKRTFQAIETAFIRAQQSRVLRVAMLTVEGAVQLA